MPPKILSALRSVGAVLVGFAVITIGTVLTFTVLLDGVGYHESSLTELAIATIGALAAGLEGGFVAARLAARHPLRRQRNAASGRGPGRLPGEDEATQGGPSRRRSGGSIGAMRSPGATVIVEEHEYEVVEIVVVDVSCPIQRQRRWQVGTQSRDDVRHRVAVAHDEHDLARVLYLDLVHQLGDGRIGDAVQTQPGGQRLGRARGAHRVGAEDSGDIHAVQQIGQRLRSIRSFGDLELVEAAVPIGVAHDVGASMTVAAQ